MRVHLRFTEKDNDLCRWRHSVNRYMLSYYLNQIILAEIDGKIAFLPNAASVSVRSEPCDVTWRISDERIKEYLLQIPSYKLNKRVKGVIRKHLQAQGMLVIGYTMPAEPKPPKVREQPKVIKQPPTQFLSPPEVKQQTVETVQSDEDREAIMALIAMGGE